MSVLICMLLDVFGNHIQIVTDCFNLNRSISPGKELTLPVQKKNGHRSASLTTEAALVFPVFFFTVALFWQLFLLLLFELQVGNVITETAMTYSYLGYAERQMQQEDVDISWIYEPLLWNSLPENKRVKDAYVRCSEEEEGIFVRVSYRFLCDGLWMPDISVPVVQSFWFYPYLGETDADQLVTPETEDLVYKTANGTVYHESKACGYLKVTVRPVELSEVEMLRNSSGERYTACNRCDHLETSSKVFVSSGGNRYHTTASCVALKRNVMELKREEIGELPVCHKCGRQENHR